LHVASGLLGGVSARTERKSSHRKTGERSPLQELPAVEPVVSIRRWRRMGCHEADRAPPG